MRVLNDAVDTLITLGEVVPVFGAFFELMGLLRDKWQALVERNDEANNVFEWAQEELDLLNVIESRDERILQNEASRRLLQRAVVKAKISINILIKIADEIQTDTCCHGCCFKNLTDCCRLVLKRDDFESAKENVKDAREFFDRALAADTNETAHEILEGQNALTRMMEARHGPGDNMIAFFGIAGVIGAGDWRIRLVLAVATLANQGMLDLSPGFLDRAATVVKLRYSDACVDMFGPGPRRALVEALANVAGVAANCTHILNISDGSLIIECSVDFGEDAIAAARFVDVMVCGQEAANDLSSLGLGDCRVLVAVAARTAKSDVPEGEYAYFVQSGASIEPYPRGVKLDSRHAHNLGVFLQDVRRDHDGAEKMYRKAIELDPSSAPPRWDLALLLETQKNDVAGAAELMEEFVRLGGVPGVEGEQRLEELREKSEALRLAAATMGGKGLHQKLDLLLHGQGISEADVKSNLPNVLPDDCEMVSYDVEADAGSATAGLRVKNIAAATELRDEVLKPGGLLAKAGVQGVNVDRGAFLESYAEAVMRFTELTAHQKDKLTDVRDAVVSVLLAPAGSGKTFIAVQRMAEVLNSDPKAKVLFVARNTALALFACKWLVAASRAAQRIVERVHVLVDPFLEGPRRVSVMIDGARLRLALDPILAGAEGYRLIVVDEAHRLAGEPKLHEQLKKVSAAEATLLFLSDGSQATKASLDAEEIAHSLVELPQGREVAVARLSEVVRSTKRIVAGASAFQLEAGRKAETTTHMLSPGPPLVARIFRLADDDEGERYAQEVVEAIVAVRHQLADLEDLNDRIAVVCPDSTFKSMLQNPLARALKGRFDLVDAATASSVLPRAETTVRRADAKAWLVVDSVDNMDGLERLVIICVGLDQVIDRGAGVLEARSRLYRAMTRAQLAVAVVNKVLPGGWLEFLGRVELSADFDDAAERENRVETAADEIVDVVVTEDAIDISDLPEDGMEVAGTPALANDAPVEEEKAAAVADAATTPPEAEPMKVLTSIWDTSAVATASRGDLRFMPFFELDPSKFVVLRTLEGHSNAVRHAASTL